jgi:hypothetical protein
MTTPIYLKKQKLKDKEKELDEKRRFWLEELKQYPSVLSAERGEV